MNKLLSGNIFKLANTSLEQLYQKVKRIFVFYQDSLINLFLKKVTSVAMSRYRDRMYLKPIAYPPTIYGDEEYEVSAKRQGNQLIRKLLRIRRHPERSVFPNEYSLEGPPKGRIYDKFPFKFTVEKDKTYSFCTCGFSNSQVKAASQSIILE